MPKLPTSRAFRAMLIAVVAVLILVAPMAHSAFAGPVSGMTLAKGKHGEGKGKGKNEAKKLAKDDDEGDDDQGDDKGNHNGKGNEGKGKKKGHEKQQEQAVAPAKLYLVAVACQFESDSNASTCLFVGGTEKGTGDVTQIAIPGDMACSDITGGSYTTSTDDSGGQMLASPNGAQAVTLVMSGRVRTSGTASYRVSTPNGLFPASGPGLRCGESNTAQVSTELSATTGAVRVIAYQCPAGTNDQTVDWYTKCAQAEPGVTFRLVQNGISSDAAKIGTTDDKGSLIFANLPAATYHLTRDGGNWCHAESDSVNAQGDVIVRANERSTVWIFNCT